MRIRRERSLGGLIASLIFALALVAIGASGLIVELFASQLPLEEGDPTKQTVADLGLVLSVALVCGAGLLALREAANLLLRFRDWRQARRIEENLPEERMRRYRAERIKNQW